MKKLCSIVLLMLFVYALTGCDTVDIENLIDDNKVKVSELETLLDEFETESNAKISDLEQQALDDGEYIDLLELRLDEIESLLQGEESGLIYIQIDGRLIALESAIDNDTIYDDQWIIDFVASYSAYDDTWISDFISSYSEYDDAWILEFISNYNEYDDAWILEFVAAYNEYDDSEIIALLDDFRLYYHIDAELPVFYDVECTFSGTGTVIATGDYYELTCVYNAMGLATQTVKGFDENGNLRSEHAITFLPGTLAINIENLKYYYGMEQVYYDGSNLYHPVNGAFLNGTAYTYDLLGIVTPYASRPERSLKDELVNFITDGRIY